MREFSTFEEYRRIKACGAGLGEAISEVQLRRAATPLTEFLKPCDSLAADIVIENDGVDPSRPEKPIVAILRIADFQPEPTGKNNARSKTHMGSD